MLKLAKVLSLTSLLFCGAIFGFFYAWVCSTMWGLDAADPRIAIAAMQAMNASVRNAAFAPSFFGTPVIMAVTAIICWLAQRRACAASWLAAALIYFCGGLLLTMAINVPMNEALREVIIPTNIEAAREIWTAYSGEWQLWNQIRTVFSGAALLLAGIAMLFLSKPVDIPTSH